ncbi:hypothetical protein Syun_026563 [Stephania yunnanensis]|uniref:AB hydrolase-1 domain-containing protein n=1 Tax=Stephania yunnanensis TaxID=152371 RepID=A0AAP0F0V1_9MAGN
MFIINSFKSLLLIPIYSLSITKSLLQTSLSILHNLFTNHNHNFFSTTTLVDHLLSFYFSYHGLKPCTINLHDQDHTSIHIWIPTHPTTTTTNSRPAIVLLHGYGGNAKWQLYRQIGPLSRDFDLYVPDLVFFGNSHSKSLHRTVSFQARSVMEAVRRVGVERVAAVFGVSYGGYVAYRMAEMYGEAVVEKVVVVSSGIGCTEEQRVEELRKFGGIDRVVEILVPENPKDLRMLMDLAFYRPPLAPTPTFVLRDFINVMGSAYINERRQILHELLTVDSGRPCPVLEQETLILWGDKDKVFPMFLAYQLARHLGKKSRVEILKDVGHAANLEAADGVNRLVKSFVLDSFM